MYELESLFFPGQIRLGLIPCDHLVLGTVLMMRIKRERRRKKTSNQTKTGLTTFETFHFVG